MINASEFQILNEKNITFINNSIDKNEIKDYNDNYNMKLISYIPFLSNDSNIDIVNLDNINRFTAENFISKNGCINNDNQNSFENIIDINGYYLFENTNKKKDLYYRTNYEIKEINISDNENENPEIYKYINEKDLYNFMFLFSTDNITKRTIAIFNNSIVLSINENKRFSVYINLINTDYKEIYTISLQSQSPVRVNRIFPIAITTEHYMGRYKFSLFINGVQSDTQITELDYNELNFVDQSSLIYPDKELQTIFWFHENENIETIIDEVYAFTITSSSTFFPVPTKYKIYPLPADIKLKNYTKCNFIINKNIKYNLKKQVKKDLKLYTYLTKTVKYSTSTNIIRNIILKNKLIKYNLLRNINITQILNLNTQLNYKFIIYFNTNIMSKIKTYSNLTKEFHMFVKFNFNTVVNYKSFIYFNTKFDIIKNVNIKNYINKIILNKQKIKSKFTRIVIHKLLNIDDINANDFNTMKIKTYRNVLKKDTVIVPINRQKVIPALNKNNTIRTVVKTIRIHNNTKFKYGNIDEYYTSTTRQIARKKIFIFKNVLRRITAIPFKSKLHIIRDIILNTKIKSLDLNRNVLKNTLLINNTKMDFYSKNKYKNNLKRKIEKVITVNKLTKRIIECRNVPWVFVINTDYYT